jgi:sugar transferase EpsL
MSVGVVEFEGRSSAAERGRRSHLFALAEYSDNAATKTAARTDWTMPNGSKRFFDVVVSLFLLPVVVPLIIIVSASSMIAFRTNPIFRQNRVGLYEESFFVYKIRSLPCHFPTEIGKRGLSDFELPRYSRLLRATHFDELPQLINVLRGQMSLVGPRPMIQDVLSRLDEHERSARAGVLPGVTGTWQVSSAGHRPLHECSDLDVMYATHAKLRHDVAYLYWTVIPGAGRKRRDPQSLRRHLAVPHGCICAVCWSFSIEHRPVRLITAR